MNIFPVSFNTNSQNNINVKTQNYQAVPRYRHTLTKDTVSFSGGKKQLEHWTKEISHKVVKEIHEESIPELKVFLRLLRDEFKPLVESKQNPSGIICPGEIGIKGRVKGPDSLREKVLAMNSEIKEEGLIKEIITKSDIEHNIGDIIATRIVLRDSSQKSFDSVFKIFENMVKKGKLKVLEVENYRTDAKKPYVTQETLEHFENVCVNNGLYPSIISKSRKSGYEAVHLNIELQNGKIAEIQIMGRDEEQTKDIQDLFYKLFDCKKGLPKKYKHIQKLLVEKVEGLDSLQKQVLDRYIFDSFQHARRIPPEIRTKKEYSPMNFLEIPYLLPEELGYRYLFQMKETADYIAKLK